MNGTYKLTHGDIIMQLKHRSHLKLCKLASVAYTAVIIEPIYRLCIDTLSVIDDEAAAILYGEFL